MYYMTAERKLESFSVKNVGINEADGILTVCGSARLQLYDEWDRLGEEVDIETEDSLLHYTPYWAYYKMVDEKMHVVSLKKTCKQIGLKEGSAIQFCTKEVPATFECDGPVSL